MSALSAKSFEDWIGRRETVTDVIAPEPVARLAATLDRADPPPTEGDALAWGWHWMYFRPPARQSELAPDGVPRRSGFLPRIANAGRMFAGAHFTFHRPLRIGETVRREGELVDVTAKAGRSGALLFLLARYSYFGARDEFAFVEDQSIVFREGPAARAGDVTTPPPGPAAAADWRRTLTPDPVLLFCYSALTFNPHRIHYDHVYARDVEGYPGLVVHGPLVVTLLLELCRDKAPERPLAGFEFRARRPLFAGAPMTLTGRLDAEGGCALAALDDHGHTAMVARATFAAA